MTRHRKLLIGGVAIGADHAGGSPERGDED
jgi:hypothetical protein